MKKHTKKLSKKSLTKCPSPTSLLGRNILSVILTKNVRTHGILLAFVSRRFISSTKANSKKVINIWSLEIHYYNISNFITFFINFNRRQ